jgi:hypothetical protein
VRCIVLDNIIRILLKDRCSTISNRLLHINFRIITNRRRIIKVFFRVMDRDIMMILISNSYRLCLMSINGHWLEIISSRINSIFQVWDVVLCTLFSNRVYMFWR